MSDSAYEKQPGASIGETATPDAWLQFQLVSTYERGYNEGWNARHKITETPVEKRLLKITQATELLRGALNLIDVMPEAGSISPCLKNRMEHAVHQLRMALR